MDSNKVGGNDSLSQGARLAAPQKTQDDSALSIKNVRDSPSRMSTSSLPATLAELKEKVERTVSHKSFLDKIFNTKSISDYSIELDFTDPSNFKKALKLQKKILTHCLNKNSNFSFLNEQTYATFKKLTDDLFAMKWYTDSNSINLLDKEVTFLSEKVVETYKADYEQAKSISNNQEFLTQTLTLLESWQSNDLNFTNEAVFNQLRALEIRLTTLNEAIEHSDKPADLDCGGKAKMLPEVMALLNDIKEKAGYDKRLQEPLSKK